MRYHKCPACRKVFGLAAPVNLAKCTFCGERSSVPVDSDTPAPFIMQKLRATALTLDGGVRHNPAATARCFPFGWNGGDGWLAKIKVISRTHIGLQIHRRFEIGATLVIKVEDNVGEQQTFMAKVVQAQDLGNNQFILGCSFCRELQVEEVQAVV